MRLSHCEGRVFCGGREFRSRRRPCCFLVGVVRSAVFNIDNEALIYAPEKSPTFRWYYLGCVYISNVYIQYN